MAWDATTLAYVRATLGKVGEVFEDGALEAFFGQAQNDLGRESVNAAIWYAVRAVATNAALLSDYSAGQTEESRSQVARQLRQMMNDWEQVVNRESATVAAAQRQVAVARPTRTRRAPKQFD
jgi:hypothetical protein